MSWIKPGEPIEREECPNGCPTLPQWAFCAACGADLVTVTYVRGSGPFRDQSVANEGTE